MVYLIMLRNYRPDPKTVNIVLMDGGVGDHIGGSLVAINYMVKRYPWITFLVWAPDFLIDFARNVLPESLSIHSFSDMEAKGYNPELPTKTTQWDGITSPMKIHQVDYAFLKLCDELPKDENKNSLQVNFNPIRISQFNLPTKYIVLTTGYTVGVREFRAESVNKIIDYAKLKGYATVFLGSEKAATGQAHVIKGHFDTSVAYHKGLKLINRTSLLEAAKIMNGAKAVVGVDNGLLHVAGCTNTDIVAGYTTVHPDVRAPYRNHRQSVNWWSVIPDASLACRFCQSNTNFLYGVDYTKCMEGDTLCVKQMTADKFIKLLEIIL